MSRKPGAIHEVVWPIEVDIIDLLAGDESLDVECLVVPRYGCSDLLGFDDHVFVRPDFIAFGLFFLRHGITRFLIDIDAAHRMTGLPIDGVEDDAVRR